MPTMSNISYGEFINPINPVKQNVEISLQDNLEYRAKKYFHNLQAILTKDFKAQKEFIESTTFIEESFKLIADVLKNFKNIDLMKEGKGAENTILFYSHKTPYKKLSQVLLEWSRLDNLIIFEYIENELARSTTEITIKEFNKEILRSIWYMVTFYALTFNFNINDYKYFLEYFIKIYKGHLNYLKKVGILYNYKTIDINNKKYRYFAIRLKYKNPKYLIYFPTLDVMTQARNKNEIEEMAFDLLKNVQTPK